ncbi:hypothetical protein BC938DRAFT_472077 [Jimgerdemannia flammicorona]|uniref:Uncharacterized protein n=1 Tax=Jimgerdemannia flammicorona TaxID=994334 RepID=A0A433QUB9_9FUNG|nr:hypothetical protein BC938DRAFT_472077 [Jimgerdemannia flammicorona]
MNPPLANEDKSGASTSPPKLWKHSNSAKVPEATDHEFPQIRCHLIMLQFSAPTVSHAPSLQNPTSHVLPTHLLSSGELQRPQLLLQLGDVVFQVEKGLGNSEFDLVGRGGACGLGDLVRSHVDVLCCILSASDARRWVTNGCGFPQLWQGWWWRWDGGGCVGWGKVGWRHATARGGREQIMDVSVIGWIHPFIHPVTTFNHPTWSSRQPPCEYKVSLPKRQTDDTYVLSLKRQDFHFSKRRIISTLFKHVLSDWRVFLGHGTMRDVSI